MNELLVTLRLIAELTQGAQRAASILSSGRDLTTEEVQDLRDRADAATSAWLSELENLREDR